MSDPPPTPDTVCKPIPIPVPSTSSHAVGIISSILSRPVPPFSSYLKVPREGVATAIEEPVYAFLCVFAIVSVTVEPLSSSPVPVKVIPVAIPNGLPVTSSDNDM